MTEQEQSQFETNPGQEETPTPETGQEEQSTPVQTEAYKKTAKDFYYEREMKRREEQVKKEAEEKLKQFEEDFKSGKIVPAEDQASLQATVKEQERMIKTYEVENLVLSQPQFAQHKDAIKEAIADEKYSGLSVEQVAYAVAGSKLLEEKQADDEVRQLRPASGMSARNIPQKDYRSMTLEEISRESNRILRQG